MRKSLFYILGIAALSSCADDMGVQNPFLNGTEKTPIVATALLDVAGAETRAADMKFEEGDELLAYLRHVTWNGTTSDPRTLVTADRSPRLVSFVKGSTEVAAYSGSDITPIGTNVALGLTSTNTNQAEDLTVSGGLYWDDFSNSIDADYDLRTDSHYLQSYYGYCYNGRTGISLTDATAGTLTWSVLTDQSSGIKTSDLLWSAEQTPIRYNHATASRPKLVLPYTHAMSKITVEVVCRAGFDDNKDENFSGAKITLMDMATTSSLTAPTMTLTKGATLGNIIMEKGTPFDDGKKSCTFSAIVAPTLIKASSDDAPFAKLEGFDGNNYDLKLTNAIITTATTGYSAWNTQLAAYDAATITPSTATNGYTAENGGLTLPGVNYHIIVTIDKQSISAKATILDWKKVSAQTEADIILDPHASEVFNDDPDSDGKIDIKTIDQNRFVQDATFSLFTLKNTSTSSDEADDNHTNGQYTYATICKYADSSDDGKDSWNNEPEIYWPNATDHYYFRALAKFNSSTGTGKSEVYNISKVGNLADAEHEEDKGVSAQQGTIAEGRDILWATTPLHYGKGSGDIDYTKYEKGSAVPPRTGGVPMAFEHIMTKVTFNLEDVNKNVAIPTDGEGNPVAADDPLNPCVNLVGAKIQITNLATSGTIQIENGNITLGTPAEKIFGSNGYIPAMLNGAANTEPPVTDDPSTEDVDETTKLLKDFMVIPQTISDDAKLIVTLANGATYSIQLNTCKVITGNNTDGTPIYGTNPIGEWTRGENYTYTILLEKEKMEFRVMIKKWDDPEEGGGKATLDWD